MVYEGFIEGFGIRLRSVEESDADFTFKIRQDKERTKYIHAVKGTVEDQKNWIKKQRARKGDYFFLVEDMEGNPLGTVGYYDIEGVNGEMGRMVLNGTFSQNCDAILQLRRFAFDIIGADYVRCTTSKGNKTVFAQLKRLGAEIVGTYVEEIDGLEMTIFRVTKDAYLKNKDKYIKLVKKSYEIR